MKAKAATATPPRSPKATIRTPLRPRKRVMHRLSRTLFEGVQEARGVIKPFGIDEAGRGPWAGPVVVAAAHIPVDFVLKTPIRDSKKLSESLRQQIFVELMDAKVPHAISVISHTDIDAVNILAATKRGMLECYEEMGATHGCEYAFVDGNILPDGITGECIIKGDDKVLSIAAASVIAKITRDALMVKYSLKHPGYGFEKHKGYGTKAHQEALAALGPCEIHRKSFKPIAKMLLPPL